MYSFPISEANVTAQGVTCRVEIPGTCPFFAGHFPGLPVLPGVAQLCLVAQVLRRGKANDAVISGIDQLRLLAPIRADETVSVRVGNPGPDARSRFAIERDGDIVSQGTLIWSGG